MDDSELLSRITQLVDEEHQLLQRRRAAKARRTQGTSADEGAGGDA